MINGKMNYYVITGSILLSSAYLSFLLWFFVGFRYGFVMILIAFINFLFTPRYIKVSKL